MWNLEMNYLRQKFHGLSISGFSLVKLCPLAGGGWLPEAGSGSHGWASSDGRKAWPQPFLPAPNPSSRSSPRKPGTNTRVSLSEDLMGTWGPHSRLLSALATRRSPYAEDLTRTGAREGLSQVTQ